MGVVWNSANHAFRSSIRRMPHAFSLQPVHVCIQCLCFVFQIPLVFFKFRFLIKGSCLWPLAGFRCIVYKFTKFPTLTALGPFEQKYICIYKHTQRFKVKSLFISFYSLSLSLSLSLSPEEQDSTKAQVEALEAQTDQDT